MFNVLSDPQVISALQGIKPFLGPTGRSVSEMVEALGELFSSESNQRAAKAFAAMLGMQDEVSTQEAGLTSLATSIPYLFFIVLPLIATQASTQTWHQDYGQYSNAGPAAEDSARTSRAYQD
ncbi:MAG: hypothetical protein ACOY9Y_15620 [Bacillota bacterium]